MILLSSQVNNHWPRLVGGPDNLSISWEVSWNIWKRFIFSLSVVLGIARANAWKFPSTGNQTSDMYILSILITIVNGGKVTGSWIPKRFLLEQVIERMWLLVDPLRCIWAVRGSSPYSVLACGSPLPSLCWKLCKGTALR